jgi:hypothetical protein
MKILFDQGTPVPLRRELAGQQVSTAYELGWGGLSNGELRQAAEGNFDLLITTDQNLKYQQNLTGRSLAILVLPTTSWPRIQQHVGEIVAAAVAMRPGEFRQIEFSD